METEKEITVILKDCERTYRQKYLSYDEIVLRADHPVIDECIRTALKNFQGEPDSIELRIYVSVR